MSGSHWLLQGNPETWRIFEAWATGVPVDTWSINRHFHDVRPGDDVALWLSGAAPIVGIYAMGAATGTAFSVDDDSGDPLWNDADRAARVRWRLPIDLHDDFHVSPISKRDLIADPRFADALIIRAPQGSIFRLTDGEWQAVRDARSALPQPPRGRRNPPWVRDELILALDVYLRHRPRLPDNSHPDVLELSEILNALPIHTERPDQETFRNPNGVHMKLGNFAALDPQYAGTGLMSGSKGDADVWDRFHDRTEEVTALAATLREAAMNGTAPTGSEEDEEEAEEGRIVFRMHRRYERDRSLRERKKAAALASEGRLGCAVCGFDFATSYGALGQGFIEVHHVVPLSEARQPIKTTLKDLALVCSNCHRMLHRAKPWLRPHQLRRLLLSEA